jgi:ABC-type lipoprotein release transport system permease subunit
MTATHFILASLRHYRRIHVAVALGVAVATAVITGALVVGDSVRGSLRDLTLERLGRVDSAVVARNFFRAELASEIAEHAEFQRHFTSAESVILAAGTLQAGSGEDRRRANSISIIGCRSTFWSLGQGETQQDMASNEIVLTDAIAKELNVHRGDSILLRIPTAGAIPADSPLGEKTETSLSRRLKVAGILPNDGLARFALAPSQHVARNAFVPLETLQGLLDQPEKANAILAATDDSDRAADAKAQQALRQALRPLLEDYGLRIEHVESPSEYIQISPEQLVLPDAAVRAAEKAFPGRLQPVVTYLANTIAVGADESPRKIPYSTISGVDSVAAIGPLLDESGEPIKLANDEIALNRWAADDLNAAIGDTITVTYYEPESTHGRLREHQPPPRFQLKTIVDLHNSAGQPTPAADPKLTPELPGVTDQESINDWDLPFELVERIRSQDEEYWDEYRTTPKAFVSLAAAKHLWPSRWGTISLLRIPEAGGVVQVSNRLLKELDPAAMGFQILPVKEQGLAASSGTTPFDFLFLAFSFFLMASAVMLIALLFQLGVEQRAGELGTLAALGVDRHRVTGLLAREGFFVAAIGAAIGVVAGIFYAWIILTGLRTWWVAAIATPFLDLHVTPRIVALGWIVGVAVSAITILWAIRRMARRSANQLLSGSAAADLRLPRARKAIPVWPAIRVALGLLIIALLILGFWLEGESQVGAFFGTGAAALVLMLGEVRHWLRYPPGRAQSRRAFTLGALSTLNMARNPARSTLTIGLVAAASFLILAVSAFKLETGEAGTGGFELLATSDLAIHYDLNTPEGRLELGLSDEASQTLDNFRVYSVRVADGEDASCLNLYRPSQPRVLGVPDALIERGGFTWAKSQGENPWMALNEQLGTDENGQPIVPVVLDASTAYYSLHLDGVGSQMPIHDGLGHTATLQVVGLLKNSVLQGNLLVSEANFLQLFPETAGYRFFLIERNVDSPSRVALDQPNERHDERVPLGTRHLQTALESALAQEGFDTVDAREQLAEFLAVQNTYLSTFQSLGAIGLLLGTIGLAVVQLRSVLERRGELALMRAGGFPNRRLVWMVLLENAFLLLGGLAVGCIAAAIALLPQWLPRDAAVPWATLAAVLGVIAAVGLAAAWLATRSALRAPILPALRGD